MLSSSSNYSVVNVILYSRLCQYLCNVCQGLCRLCQGIYIYTAVFVHIFLPSLTRYFVVFVKVYYSRLCLNILSSFSRCLVVFVKLYCRRCEVYYTRVCKGSLSPLLRYFVLFSVPLARKVLQQT